MVIINKTASFSNDILAGVASPGAIFITGSVLVKTASIVGLVALTFDWTNGGAARQQTLNISLASLGLAGAPFNIPFFMDANSYIYLSGAVVGSVNFDIQLGYLTI